MTRTLRAAVVLAMAFAVVPAAGATASTAISCPSTDGREHLTTEGFKLSFDAPAVTSPELASPVDTRQPHVTRQRTAHFFFRADLVPYRSAGLDLSLTWAEAGDYDLYVINTDNEVIGRSDESNIDGGTAFERVVVEDVAHCSDLRVEVRSWAGRADETLRLEITAKDFGAMLACAEGDPAPGCAGKEAGAAPDPVPDARKRLYLGGGRPGQASMLSHYVDTTGNTSSGLPSGALAEARPTGGVANTYTRPAAGFDNQYRNPFQAHFPVAMEGKRVTGDVHALVWLSSQTMKDGGTLNVDLWADNGQVQRVTIPGDKVGTVATPHMVTFAGVDLEVLGDLTLQISAKPAVGSAGPGNPADAEFTVYYDSVQFQSMVVLPARGRPHAGAASAPRRASMRSGTRR